MKKNITLLGFDFGTRKTGLAVGQSITCTAQPLITVPTPYEDHQWAPIDQLVQTWQPDKLLVGLPFNEGYDDKTTYEAALAFVGQLQARFSRPVETVDEHLTSFSARQIIKERGLNLQKISLDAIAAMLILESWLQQYD